MFRNQRGQISLGAITIAASLAVAMIGGWIAQNNITNGKIEDLRIEQQTKMDILSTKIEIININVALICQKLNVKCRE